VSKRTAYGETKSGEPENTGRMGFREPDEPPDSRPVIWRRPFWRDDAEEEAYLHAVSTNPRRPKEGAMAYIERLAAIASGRLGKAAQSMPKAKRMSDAEWNDRQNEAAAVREPGEEG
jgi:hypothetical protein